MDQLINTMLANAQIPQIPAMAKKGESSAQKDRFQKLLEQKQSDTAQPPRQEKTEPAQNSQSGQKTQEAQESAEPQQAQAGPKDGKELEEQMTLAAMMLLRNPLVADIAEETPQVLTDPNWEDGLVPVSYADNEEGTLRIVSWMPDGAESGEDLSGLNAAAGEWIEAQNEAEAAPEAQLEAPDTELNADGPAIEIKVETGKTDAGASDAEDEAGAQGAEAEAPVFEDVKAVPVKVGEAPKASAKPGEIMEKQIAPKVNEALANGQTRVDIQLNPENLGKITIQMTAGEDGKLLVVLHAENRDTQNLLSKDMTKLAELLGRETQQEVRVEVPRQEESQRQDLYEQQQEQRQRQQQEQRRKRETAGEDFLQQLRLGLIPLDGE